MRGSWYTCAVALALTSTVNVAYAALAGDWQSRSVYQVLTDRFAVSDGSTDTPCDTAASSYCGGTWKGIIKKLDYIQDMGFTAVMISPVMENLKGNTSEGEAYHGYWPQDLYAVNSNFGTAQDLKDLSQELHDRDMYLMVDIVINDLAYYLKGKTPSSIVDYSVFNPFNSEKYFHDYCLVEDWSNETQIQLCNIGDKYVGLLDLNTTKTEVITMYETWVKELVSNYSIDGLRIDAAKHVNHNFLTQITDAAGVFTVGEVYVGSASYACNFQNYMPSVPNYPVYWSIIQAFTVSNISDLVDYMSYVKEDCSNITLLGSFSENHDLPRFASYTSDMALAKNVMTFTLLNDGIPFVYQGQEQHFNGSGSPANREALWTSDYDTSAKLYTLTKTLMNVRNTIAAAEPSYLTTYGYPIYEDGSTIVMRKGPEGHQIITVLSASGKNGGTWNLTLSTAFEPGISVTEVLTCKTETTSSLGQTTVSMSAGEPRVLVETVNLNGTGLCNGVGEAAVASETTSSSSSASMLQLPLMQLQTSLYIVLTWAIACWFIL